MSRHSGLHSTADEFSSERRSVVLVDLQWNDLLVQNESLFDDTRLFTAGKDKGKTFAHLLAALQVVDYLVWAAVSTEMCLPLLSISYLPWRSTLYCAACEAFYDTRVAPDGEVNELL